MAGIRFLFVLLCIVFSCGATAHSLDSFRVDPDDVAYYQRKEAVLSIKSVSRFTLEVHQVLTILQEQGKGLLYQVFELDEFNKLDQINIRVFNDKGVFLRSYDKSDFEQQQPVDEVNLVTGIHQLRFHIPVDRFPCTLDMQYTLKSTGYMNLPDFYFGGRRIPTDSFSFRVITPPAYRLRHRVIGAEVKPVLYQSKDTLSYHWFGSNWRGQHWESNSYEGDFHDRVELAPIEFEYDGFAGSFENWQRFGSFIQGFYLNKQTLSPERVQDLHRLLVGAQSRRDSVQLLYREMQRTCRYVSIQLGIGGFKPMDAQRVDKVRYGDCKALTNYLRVMLDYVKIPAYPFLVYAGARQRDADTSFPSNVFNHVILCVPNGADSIWVECTSSTNDVDVLGSFTENRHGLLLTPTGSRWVSTPSSSASRNRQEIRANIELQEERSTAQVQLWVDGEYKHDIRQLMQGATQAEGFKRRFSPWVGMRVPAQLSVGALRDSAEGLVLSLRMEDEQWMVGGYSNLFFKGHVWSMAEYAPLPTGMRKTDFVFDYPTDRMFETTYQIPVDFTVSSWPRDTSLTHRAMSYTRSVSFDASHQRLTIRSQLKLPLRAIPPNAYPGFARLYNSMLALEAEKIILQRK